MRIAVEHRTQYRFSEPQARLIQLLRMTPCDTQDQTVVSWMIGVDCDARVRESEDGYGNTVLMLYADGPIEEIEISVTGEVLTIESSGVVRGSNEPLPPIFYRRSTKRTLPGDKLPVFAGDSAYDGGDPLDRLHRLNSAFHARFPRIADAPDTGLSVIDAFEREDATARDAAQMFITAVRGFELPARYVSGYRTQGGSLCAAHAWAEAHIDGLGWVGFDPATGLSTDESYVRVAIGLDATAAAPIAGSRVGAGEEELDVDLQVDRITNGD